MCSIPNHAGDPVLSLLQVYQCFSCTKETKTGHNSLWPHKWGRIAFNLLSCKAKKNPDQLLPSNSLYFSHPDLTVCIMCKSKFLLWPQLFKESIRIICLFLNGFGLFRGHYGMGEWNFRSKKKKKCRTKILEL